MQNFRGVASGVSGSAAFAVFLFALHVPFLGSAAAGGAVFAAAFLLIGNRKQTDLSVDFDGVSEEVYKETIKEGMLHADAIKTHSRSISDESVREKVSRISQAADQIFETLAKKPKKLKTIRDVFTYYLAATNEVLAKYIELKRRNVKDPQIQETIAKAESNLELIAELFEKKLVRLVSDDVMDLDVELETLETMLKSEGLK